MSNQELYNKLQSLVLGTVKGYLDTVLNTLNSLVTFSVSEANERVDEVKQELDELKLEIQGLQTQIEEVAALQDQTLDLLLVVQQEIRDALGGNTGE